jgi:hypothetical protein
MRHHLRRGSATWWCLGLLTALALTTPAWLPWLDPRQNLWEVDDAKNHLLRLYVLEWLIRHGVWYPRWVPDLFGGYGYPLFNYYAPGFYYLALLLKALLRLDFWDAYRAAGVAAALLAAAGAYALSTTLWQRASAGVLSAVALLSGPYAIQLNLFKRGDIPEALGLALIPWLLLAMWKLWHASGQGSRAATGPRRGVGSHAAAALVPSPGPAAPVEPQRGTAATLGWLLAVVGLSVAEILAHNLTALAAAVLSAIWVLYLLLARPSVRAFALVAGAGLLAGALTAFFWLPAAVEGSAVQLEWLRRGDLDYRHWLLDPAGATGRQQSPDNRQTRTGLLDLHLRYPHQLIATPKPGLAQATIAVLTITALAGAGWRRVRRGASRPFLPPASTSGGERIPLSAAVPLLAVAGTCWLLTFTFAGPVWERVPPLQLVQFPWRLLGPSTVCLAIAAGAGVSWLLARLTRLQSAWGRPLEWLVAGACAMLLLAHGLSDRQFAFDSAPSREIDGRALVADETRDRFGMGTTSGREFLPREVELATYTSGQPRGRDVFERLYPESEWSGGLFLPLAGDLRLLGWHAQPLRISVRVANDGAGVGRLGIRQTRFPGWRAWLDGRVVPVQAAPLVPEQQATAGFMVVDVPPGEHVLALAFGPTPPRLAGIALSVAAALAAAAALLWEVRRRWGLPPLPAAGAWLALALAIAYLAWRGVRPMVPSFAAVPVPPAQPKDGVWGRHAAPGAGTLLVNLAEAVRAGQAVIADPSGQPARPGSFVDVRQLTVTDEDDPGRGVAGTARKQWLYLHPPAEVAVDVAVPRGREVWFQAALALDPQVWTASLGDGASFQVLVAPIQNGQLMGPTETLLDQAVIPRSDRGQRRWLPVEADLSPWGGQTVRLTLRTSPRQDFAFDWAGFGNPMVVVRHTGRVRAPEPRGALRAAISSDGAAVRPFRYRAPDDSSCRPAAPAPNGPQGRRVRPACPAIDGLVRPGVSGLWGHLLAPNERQRHLPAPRPAPATPRRPEPGPV